MSCLPISCPASSSDSAEPGVGIGQRLLEPRPVVRAAVPVEVEEPSRQHAANAAGVAITREAADVRADSQQRERPGARAGEGLDRGQAGVEQVHGQSHQPVVGRLAGRAAQAPERAPVTVLGARVLEPAPVVAQEVAEAAVGRG